MTTPPTLPVIRPARPCAFGDCNHPASMNVGTIRACSHREGTMKICQCCFMLRKHAPASSPCTTCGVRNHISLYLLNPRRPR